jgi:hypothetical protein
VGDEARHKPAAIYATEIMRPAAKMSGKAFRIVFSMLLVGRVIASSAKASRAETITGTRIST